MDSARYVLRYLQGTRSHGISYHQSADSPGTPQWPSAIGDGSSITTYTDSNWGPQDASVPHANETRMVTNQEV
jgi:hypothetical protein